MHALLGWMALAVAGAGAGPAVGPAVVAETPGGAVSDFGSWYAVKAVTAGARAQEPAALAIYDARANAPPDRPVGIFSVAVLEGAAMPRLQGARARIFRAHGWEEHPVDGTLSADVAVFTLERNVFAVVVTLRGVTAPLSLSAVLNGTGAAAGTALGEAVVLDDGRGRPFGVFAGTTAPGGITSFTGGGDYRWQVMLPVPADGTFGFVLAFHDAPGSAEALGMAALAGHGAPDGWLAPVEASWGAYMSSFPSAGVAGSVPQAWEEADAIAQATLRMNRDARGGGGGAGIARSKTAADHFWLLDSSLAALALSEVSAEDAFAALEPLLAGQVPEAAGAAGVERGLIPNRVDETGVAPPPGSPLATADYSAPPVLATVLRILWERSARDDAARASLERAHGSAAALRGWWVRRRDLDGNGLLEVNGGLEAEMPGSPRFALWGATADLPFPEDVPRARLNAVDLNAWVQWAELELSRTATVLGRDDARSWLDVAGARAALLDDAAKGFWDEEGAAWVDYALDSSQVRIFQDRRTPASFWPLVVGAERDPGRVSKAAAALVNPAGLWSPHGIASLATIEIGFSPDEPWRGAVSPWQSYFVLQGLYRYGFEAEATALRARLLDTIAGQPAMFAHHGALTGVGLGLSGSTSTAAVFIEALRRRYEEEAFALSGGRPAAAREGRIRRLLRFRDGAVLAEIAVEGIRELPRTRFFAEGAEGEIFSGDPMGVTFADPTGAVGGRAIAVTMPAFDQAEIEIARAGGQVEALTLEGAPVAFTARVGDEVSIRRYHFAGERACGCGAGTGAGAAGPAVAALAGWVLAYAMARARRGRGTGAGGPRSARRAMTS